MVVCFSACRLLIVCCYLFCSFVFNRVCDAQFEGTSLCVRLKFSHSDCHYALVLRIAAVSFYDESDNIPDRSLGTEAKCARIDSLNVTLDTFAAQGENISASAAAPDSTAEVYDPLMLLPLAHQRAALAEKVSNAVAVSSQPLVWFSGEAAVRLTLRRNPGHIGMLFLLRYIMSFLFVCFLCLGAYGQSCAMLVGIVFCGV